MWLSCTYVNASWTLMINVEQHCKMITSLREVDEMIDAVSVPFIIMILITSVITYCYHHHCHCHWDYENYFLVDEWDGIANQWLGSTHWAASFFGFKAFFRITINFIINVNIVILWNHNSIILVHHQYHYLQFYDDHCIFNLCQNHLAGFVKLFYGPNTRDFLWLLKDFSWLPCRICQALIWA